MKLVLLQFLLGIWQYWRHDAGNAFAAALEDIGIPIPDSADLSLFATDSAPGLNNLEGSTQFLDSDVGTGDVLYTGASWPFETDVFANQINSHQSPETLSSPLSSSVDIPYTTAFNAHEPPEGFAPCTNGKRYSCCIDVSFYLPYPLDCIWYDYNTVSQTVRAFFCQPENIFCCQDVDNDGMKEELHQPGNQGHDCEPATPSTVTETLPEQPDQFDWQDAILKVLFYKNPLFQIPAGAPGES